MLSLFEYIDIYGNYSFLEKEFNEVDNVILSLLSYIDFNGIVSSGKEKISLKDASSKYFNMYTEEELNNNIFSIRSAIKIFRYIKDFKRYQQLYLYNYVYKKKKDEQFSAICIKIKDDLIYVSFEGTDELISGWKEDFELSYKFPIKSQLDAVKYLDKVIHFRDKNVIVGGHSKGGNLAMYSAMYCNFWVRQKIIKIYNNDGPGIPIEEISSYRFRRIRYKYIHIIPDKSIIGVIFNNYNDQVVESDRHGIFAHDATTWKVEDNKFKRVELKERHDKFRKVFNDWLSECSYFEKEKCVNEIFSIFEKNNINTVIDMKNLGFSGIIKLLIQSNTIDERVKELFKQLISLMFEEFTSDIKGIISFNKKES